MLLAQYLCSIHVACTISMQHSCCLHNIYAAFMLLAQYLCSINFACIIYRLLLASSWCPTKPDFAGFGMHLNSTLIPYHYFDNSFFSQGIHSPSDEKYGILKLQRCGFIGQDLTHSVNAVNNTTTNSSSSTYSKPF